MVCGIYSILNKENGKIYVGLSTNVDRRWKEHRSELNQGKHHNSYLQNAWNKYGESAFEFNILEYCDEDELSEKEIFWIEYFDSNNKIKGYNQITGGDTNIGTDNPMYGKHHKLESRKMMSIHKKGKYTGKNNHFYGKQHSKESRIKMSMSRKGEGSSKWGTSVIEEWGGLWFLKTMAEFGFSSVQTSKYTGISKSNILNYLKVRGYSWKELRGDNKIKHHLSKETKQKLSEAMKGREVSDETRRKISKARKGKKLSIETRKKLSEAKKGKKLSEEARIKMSESKNTSGYFRVHKVSNKRYNQGFTWVYRYYDENGKRKGIYSVDINELEKKVKAKGLDWYKIN